MNTDVRAVLEAVKDGRMPEHEAVSLLAALQAGAAARPGPTRRRTSAAPEPTSARRATYPLSQGQQALWVLHQKDPDSAAYNLPLALRLRPGTDPDRLAQSLQIVLQQHAVLHTNVRLEHGSPVGFDSERAVDLVRLDMSHLPPHEVHERLEALVRVPFDLEREPLQRAWHVATGGTDALLLLVFHHLITDGVATHVLVREIGETYEKLERGEPVPRRPAVRAYDAFVRWQQELLAGAAGARHREYWRSKLAGASTAVLDELADRARGGRGEAPGESVSFEVDPATWGALHALARQERVSVFAVAFGAFVGLLHLHTRQPEIYVAVPVEGRPRKEFERTVGLFVNTAVLKCACPPRTSWRELVAVAYREMLESEEHADYPYIALMDALREAGRPELQFDVAFYFQSGPGVAEESTRGAGCIAGVLPEPRQQGEFALAAEVVAEKTRATVHFKYRPALFERGRVERLAEHYRVLLAQIVADPARAVNATALFTARERDLVASANRTDADLPLGGTVADLVLEQARRRPAAVALVDEAGTYSYGELVARVEDLADELRGRALTPGSLVGVFLDRRAELVLAMLAVQRAECAYVPLDPSLPEARLRFVIEDAGIGVVLTQASLLAQLEAMDVEAVVLDGRARHDGPSAAAASAGRTRREGRSDSAFNERAAYVLYTSGSTGTPKGVEVSQGSLLNFLLSMADKPGCAAGDHLLAVTTVSFDIAALELFLPLICGATVEIVSSEVARDGLRLRGKLDSSPTTVMQATPATWQMLLSAGWSGRRGLRLLCGGEALPRELADRLLARVDEVWNMYGPTETTVWSSLSRVVRGQAINVGRPIANTRLHLLDEDGHAVPFGARGELYIGGDGVARGYRQRPELTADRFLPDPFRADGSRVFRTGDLARFLPDGSLEHLGRLDSQVKIRGFRVELGEIEATLRKHERVVEAKVVLREDAGGHRALVAFAAVTGVPEDGLADSLREHLHRWLPDYMVPARWVWLKSFPLTPNRKTDTRPLKEWTLDAIAEQFGPPGGGSGESGRSPRPEALAGAQSASLPAGARHLLEADLQRIVAEIVGVAAGEVSVRSALGEYGFDSVRFTSLSLRLNQRYDVSADATVFYQHPTVSGLAAHLMATWPEHIRRAYGAMPADAEVRATRAGTPARAGHARSAGAPSGRRFAPVAIIGMGGRLPGAETLDEFWSHLVAGRDLVGPYPQDRAVSRRLFERYREGADAGLFQGAFLRDVGCFDAPLFRVSPREAAQMDPQQRLLLQAAREAIEDAGYAPAAFSSSATGVFVGLSASDYFSLMKYEMDQMDDHFLIGNAHSVAANRISYLFNLQGPSATFDTACSSSAVAIHRAVCALQEGACDAALAGGANLILSPYAYLGLKRAGMLAADGRCRTFDERASGYGRGEGVGLVLLKRLDRAQADGDPVHAVVIGSAENHGGRTHSLTVPNPRAQADVVIAAHEAAGIPPRSVGYIEAHGTGTQLGDPLEVGALKQAFAHLRTKWGESEAEAPHIGLGSVKTNIGHLEAAAGVAGVLKLILALRQRTLPGLVHFERPNKLIDLAGSPFYLQAQTTPWEPRLAEDGSALPRRAGVSSFGMGGSNVHLVLEERPAC